MHPKACLKSGLLSDPTSGAAISVSSAEHQGTTNVGGKKSGAATHAHTHARTPGHAHTQAMHAGPRTHARTKNENVIRAGRESTQGDELAATLGYWLTPVSIGTRNKYDRARSKWRKQHRSQGRRRRQELTTTGEDIAICFVQYHPHANRMPAACHARRRRSAHPRSLDPPAPADVPSAPHSRHPLQQ